MTTLSVASAEVAELRRQVFLHLDDVLEHLGESLDGQTDGRVHLHEAGVDRFPVVAPVALDDLAVVNELVVSKLLLLGHGFLRG